MQWKNFCRVFCIQNTSLRQAVEECEKLNATILQAKTAWAWEEFMKVRIGNADYDTVWLGLKAKQ